jgi:hypothetical protein
VYIDVFAKIMEHLKKAKDYQIKSHASITPPALSLLPSNICTSLTGFTKQRKLHELYYKCYRKVYILLTIIHTKVQITEKHTQYTFTKHVWIPDSGQDMNERSVEINYHFTMGTKKGVVKSATPRIHCAVMPPSSVM